VDWVILLYASGSKSLKRKRLGNMFFWWHVWKERNSKIFDNKELSVPSVANLLMQDILMFSVAWF
jgi:hypothetical protein